MWHKIPLQDQYFERQRGLGEICLLKAQKSYSLLHEILLTTTTTFAAFSFHTFKVKLISDTHQELKIETVKGNTLTIGRVRYFLTFLFRFEGFSIQTEASSMHGC